MEKESDNILWLVPIKTKTNQCLHIRLTRTQDIINIVASEYQCLYGHRHSKLLAEKMESVDYENEDDCTEFVLELKEEESCNVVAALVYMHSDSSDLIFPECSLLQLARTAKFMRIGQLCDTIVSHMTEVLRHVQENTFGTSATTAGVQNGLEVSIWDAIAVLHMLGDPCNALPADISEWCIRNPNLLADEALFSSCRHLYSPTCLATLINCVIRRHEENITALCDTHTSELNSCQLSFLNLTADVEAMLQHYVGKRIASKNRRRLEGTVLRVHEVTRTELVVMWHHNATVGSIKIRNLCNFKFV